MIVPSRSIPSRSVVASSSSGSRNSGRRAREWRRCRLGNDQLLLMCAVAFIAHQQTGALLVSFVVAKAIATSYRRRRRRRLLLDEIDSELPDALSLIQVAVAAGAGPRQALLTLDQALLASLECTDSVSHFRTQLLAVGRALRLGFGIRDAFNGAFEQRIEQIDRINVLLMRSERDGQALAQGLDRLSRELRRRRMLALDSRAQRATIGLLFPLVFCILPAFLLLVVLPVIITIFDGMQPVSFSR